MLHEILNIVNIEIHPLTLSHEYSIEREKKLSGFSKIEAFQFYSLPDSASHLRFANDRCNSPVTPVSA